MRQVVCQVEASNWNHIIHDLAPLNSAWDDKNWYHGISGIIKVQERILPVSSHIQAIPLVFYLLDVVQATHLTIVKLSFEVIDPDDSEDEDE